MITCKIFINLQSKKSIPFSIREELCDIF